MKRLLIPVLLFLVMGVGCVPGGPITITTTTQPPVINSFDARPPTIAAGESATLSWSVAGATAVSIDQGVGNVALTGSRAVTPSVTIVYTLTATNAAGSSTATAQVIVSGAPSPPPSPSLPVVNSFTASPPSITVGGSATLSWNVSNATSVTIDQGVGVVASSGTTSVFPAATTTYTLTAANAAGSTTASAQVVVSGAPSPSGLPVVNYFMANPPTISAGGTTTLGWSVSNATSVTIDQGVGAVGLVGTAPVSPATTTSYTLTASNAAGLYSLTITVMVTGAPSPPGPDTTPPTVPVLLSPSIGATLPQPSSPWSFDWADSSDTESGIKQYQLYVIHSGAINPAIDEYVTASYYTKTSGGYIGHDSLTNWTWKVRAQNNAGLWSDWSPVRVFKVEPKITSVLDITQTGMGASAVFGWSSGYVNVGQGQSFKVTQAGWFDEFQIYLSSSQPTSTSDIIRCDMRNAAGTVLQSVSVAGFAAGSGRWVKFSFGSQKYITPGTYYCTCYVVSPAANHWYSIHANTNDASYPDGGRYVSTGGSPQNWGTWVSYPWDLAFKAKILVGP
ncbi:MAG: hypothetical protein FJ006_00800 [Chloroflexi bacterium]|nr:hypothetical protein [Chloroflexota bacterium]